MGCPTSHSYIAEIVRIGIGNKEGAKTGKQTDVKNVHVGLFFLSGTLHEHVRELVAAFVGLLQLLL